MTREEQEALNEAGEATPEIESPTVEPEVQAETPETAAEESPSGDESAPAEGAEPEIIKKKSAEARIRELNDQLKKERERNRSLETSVEKVHKESEENPFSPENNPLPDPELSKPNENGEITREQYAADVARNARRAVQLELSKQRQAAEATKAMELFPQLDPKSDQFDEDLSDVITETVEAKVKLNPGTSVLATVQKLMKPYQKVAESAVSNHAQDVAGQAARAAIRPSANTAPVREKTVEEMTEAEIEAKYGKVNN